MSPDWTLKRRENDLFDMEGKVKMWSLFVSTTP